MKTVTREEYQEALFRLKEQGVSVKAQVVESINYQVFDEMIGNRLVVRAWSAYGQKPVYQIDEEYWQTDATPVFPAFEEAMHELYEELEVK